MKITKNRIFILLIILIVTLLKFFLSNEITFFWDSISCLSRPAHFFYENNMNSLVYSEIYDNGDPHIIAFYLAFIWILFGKSLFITHLAFLPICIGVIYQIILLCKKYLENKKEKIFSNSFILGCLLVLSDPTVFTQIILLGTDLWVLFFGLYGINKIIDNNKWNLSIAFIGLCLTNRRGMIIAATLMIIYVIQNLWTQKEKTSIKKIFFILIPTLPACIIVLLYTLFRFHNQGWIFSNPDSPWFDTGQLVDIKGFIHNFINLIWRNIDFGRIALWIIFFFLLFKFGLKKIFNEKTQLLWLCHFLLLFSFVCVTLPISNPFGARYFILQFVLFAIIIVKLLFDLMKPKQAKIITIFLILFSLGGNLWLYPEKIAQNWDASLKHLPFYSLRKECLEYIRKEKIDYDIVASGFCIYGEQKYIDLKENNIFIPDKISNKTEYYIYSNISNLDDEIIDELHQWKEIKLFEKNGVFIKILKKENLEYTIE